MCQSQSVSPSELNLSPEITSGRRRAQDPWVPIWQYNKLNDVPIKSKNEGNNKYLFLEVINKLRRNTKDLKKTRPISEQEDQANSMHTAPDGAMERKESLLCVRVFH